MARFRRAIPQRDLCRRRRRGEVAALYIAQLDDAGVFEAPIVTRVEQGHPFYRAEDRHQDFVVRNPVSSYVVNIDLPKIDDLERVFPDRFRAESVLVLGD